MTVLDIAGNIEFKAAIMPVTSHEFTIIKRSKRFVFNWGELRHNVILKLVIDGKSEILGLMCIEDHHEGYDAIEIGLLELSKENIGKNKQFNHIAGCLIAYACRESIKNGHEGWVFLKPKSSLVTHYREHYGFEFTGYNMVSDTSNSQRLIRKYL